MRNENGIKRPTLSGPLPVALAALAVLLPAGACERVDHEYSPGPEEFWSTRYPDTGPDWEVVQAYIDQPETADVYRSAAAARAILEEDGEHEKTVEAAEFLANLTRFRLATAALPGVDKQIYAGLKGLLIHAPEYEEWPQALLQIHRFSELVTFDNSTRPATDAFLEEAVSKAEDPVLRSAARYFLAAGLMRSANDLSLSPEHREDKRRQALTLATGLMSGVEHDEFLVPAFGGSATRTFANAEADLVRRIHHATVGGTLPELSGTRFDGVEERLADYRGRVALLDFWATWCGPCLAALPDLRELVARLPPDRFALLAISVDADLETATEFFKEDHVIELLNKAPAPWANWHVGVGSAIQWQLDVDTFPTYILVDHRGRILARTHQLSEELVSLIEEAVASAAKG